MADATPLLADVWFWLLGFILLLYVALDGYDLGAGTLFLFTRDKTRQDLVKRGLGYNWHANQTWLVVAGGLLFGAFPLAYSVVLSALYVPVSLMLLGLIFRTVSFEFQEQSRHQAFRILWGLRFGAGSLMAALAQGFILGAIIEGLKVNGDAFAGGIWTG